VAAGAGDADAREGPLNWVEVSVVVDAETAEAVNALFEQHGDGGAVVEEVPLQPGLVDERELRDAPAPEGGLAVRRVIKAFLPAGDEARLEALRQALWHLSQLRPLPEPEIRELGPADWAEAWKSGYQVLTVGPRMRIVPSWIPYEPAPGEVTITLDPGMAFGTGLHPTTQLCLQALEDLIVPGMRVLDVGTGSGILAIAAAKLGAAEVLGLDIDMIAVRTARENMQLNGVDSVVRVERGSVDTADHGAYDLVLANILAEINARLAPDLARHTAPQGWLVASGILDTREPVVTQAFAAAGLEVARCWQQEDWLALGARHTE